MARADSAMRFCNSGEVKNGAGPARQWRGILMGGKVDWGQEEARGGKKIGRRGPVPAVDEEPNNGGGAAMASLLTEERAHGRMSAGFPVDGRSP